MARKIFVRVLLATAAFAGFTLSPSVSAATVVGSYGAGLNIGLSVFNLVAVSIPYVAYAGALAPPNYNLSNSLLTFTSSNVAGVGTFNVATGVIDDTASGSLLPLTATGTSTVNGLNSGLSLPILGSLLNVSAKTLTSTSTSSYLSGRVVTGSSQIEDLDISGSLFGSDILLNVNALATTPINDILFSAGGLTIIANHQIPLFDGSAVAGIETTALSIELNGFVFGTGLLNGNINIADSAAIVTGAPAAAVPEPASWAMLLLGFGVVGAVARRRRTLALA